ncbi:MAG: YdeI/OmpD-associated family protein [Ignavibacteriae bacterium]|nr:YdeI/OmpD-associated family protein [Ignavibacteriota bacterium]
MSLVNNEAKKLIDEYIEELPDFSREICIKLRELIHATDPDIVEDWKWGPNFNKQGMICGFSAFREHVTFTFFEGASMKDPKKLFTDGQSNAHNRGIKYRTVSEIDEKTVIKYIQEAVAINAQGIKKIERTIIIPDDFKQAMKIAHVLDKFESSNYTNRKEYVNWIESAKKLETRESRIQKAVDKIAQGIKFS